MEETERGILRSRVLPTIYIYKHTNTMKIKSMNTTNNAINNSRKYIKNKKA